MKLAVLFIEFCDIGCQGKELQINVIKYIIQTIQSMNFHSGYLPLYGF